jgi:hypothetical protein
MRGATLAAAEPVQANPVLWGPGTVMARSGVVQLVERRPLEPVVAGSSPAPRATKVLLDRPRSPRPVTTKPPRAPSVASTCLSSASCGELGCRPADRRGRGARGRGWHPWTNGLPRDPWEGSQRHDRLGGRVPAGPQPAAHNARRARGASRDSIDAWVVAVDGTAHDHAVASVALGWAARLARQVDLMTVAEPGQPGRPQTGERGHPRSPREPDG